MNVLAKIKVPPLRKPNPKTPFRRQSLYWLCYCFFSVAILSSLASGCHRYGTASYVVVVLCSREINRAWPPDKGYVGHKTRLAVAPYAKSQAANVETIGAQLNPTSHTHTHTHTHTCFDTGRQRETLNSALGNSNTTSVLLFFQLRLIHAHHQLQFNFPLLYILYCPTDALNYINFRVIKNTLKM